MTSFWQQVGFDPRELTRPLPKYVYARGNASTYYVIVRGKYGGSYATVDEAKTARDKLINES